MNSRFKLMRIVRTSSSEIFVIWEDDERIGQLDVHYAGDTIHATLILETDLSVTSEEELLSQVDQDVVSSYLPIFNRGNLLVTVYRGEEISTYTDAQSQLDDEEDDES